MEQQIKLPTLDKANVSDSDGYVSCSEGFPGGCTIQNLQILSVKAEKRVGYHKASP